MTPLAISSVSSILERAGIRRFALCSGLTRCVVTDIVKRHACIHRRQVGAVQRGVTVSSIDEPVARGGRNISANICLASIATDKRFAHQIVAGKDDCAWESRADGPGQRALGQHGVVIDGDPSAGAHLDSFIGPRIQVHHYVVSDPAALMVIERLVVSSEAPAKTWPETEGDAHEPVANDLPF